MLRSRLPAAPSAIRRAVSGAKSSGAQARLWAPAAGWHSCLSGPSSRSKTRFRTSFNYSRDWLATQIRLVGAPSQRTLCTAVAAEVQAEAAQPQAEVGVPLADVPVNPVLTPAQQALQPAKPLPPQPEEIEIDPEKLDEELSNASPLEIMDRALGMYGKEIAIAFSGAEDVALIEFAHLSAKPYRVFTVDTGRMHPETYKFLTEVEKHYNIQIEYVFPDPLEIEKLTKDKGLFSFYQDGHEECCGIRRVNPITKKLKGLRSWITGQRRDQASVSRSKLPFVQIDPSYDGKDGPETLLKWNPLAKMSNQEIWRFLTNMNVPINELHTKGYSSIGCEPCTRSILPWQHEREGRWWWEENTGKEVGVNMGNMKSVRIFRRQPEFGGDLYSTPAIFKFSREEMRALGKTTSRAKSGIVCLYAPWCPHCQAMDAAYKELAEKLEGTDIYIAKFRADGVNKLMCQTELMMTTFPTILFFPKNSSKFIKYPSERRDVNSLYSFVMSFK